MPFVMSLALAAAFTSIAQGDDAIHLTLVPKGGMAKIGYYAPQKTVFAAEKPDAIKKAPDKLEAPQYGMLAVGDGVAFILDEPDGKPATLYVDSNHNGDFTDDPAATWKAKESKSPDGKKSTMYSGGAMADIGEAGKPLLVNIMMYRFDKSDPSRAALKSTLLYYRDYAYEGQVTLGDKSFKAVLSDEFARGDFRVKPAAGADAKEDARSGVALLVDVNGNGKFDARGESFDAARPFNVGGTTWEITDMSRDGSSFKIVKSSQTVAEITPPPDMGVGKDFPPFEAKDTDGKAVNFPGDFKGKVVLVDFWATWCGPCMAEMPNVVAAYGKYHDKGFEIMGISLDNEKTITKMPEVMKSSGMTWRQVADGKGWEAEIAKKYVIQSIPATFLVDGSTGKVIGANMRGPALEQALEKALSKSDK